MKISFLGMIVAASLAAASSSVNAQTLGTASKYDIFVQNGGDLELKDANQLFGSVGISNGAELDGRGESNVFDGTIFKHTGGTIKDGAGLGPSGGILSSAAIDAELNQANIDLANYITYLDSFGVNNSNIKQTTSYEFFSTMSLTVLDFEEIDLDQETFTLNGRDGGMDTIIIRTNKALEFKDSDVVLNNLKRENVIWYHTGSDNFDLHKSDQANDDPTKFMNFEGTIISTDGEVRLGEVSFTGQVFGSDLKMGSGFVFQVPEPSSSLMMIFGACTLLLVRRRQH